MIINAIETNKAKAKVHRLYTPRGRRVKDPIVQFIIDGGLVCVTSFRWKTPGDQSDDICM